MGKYGQIKRKRKENQEKKKNPSGKGTGRKKPVKGNQNIFDELEWEGKKKSGTKVLLVIVCCFLIQSGIGLPFLQLAVLHGDYAFLWI